MRKLLVANRGEIAVRIIRACRELDVRTVAVHSTADAGSLHAKLADESICIGPGPSPKSYLNIPAIMSAAEVTGVDAVHPGYGFLAENHEFARVCTDYGITFVGPKPEHIRRFGDKIVARQVAVEAGLPLIPSSNGAVADVAEAVEIAAELGYPVMIKAAAGGGGKGLKVATDKADIERLFPLAQREAQTYFADGTCYLERHLLAPRHIEAQVLIDREGTCHYIGERDCSLQRRQQKILEEAPAPKISDAERATLQGYSEKLFAGLGYESLATVEFLYDQGNFYFLEVNTRVQVEHPVTEMITGIDLVKQQIRVAMGDTPCLESYNFGHAIECRINAEDPDTFAPSPGTVRAYHQPGGPGVRVDSMLYQGCNVSPLYDSMVGKVITHGRDRMECIARMQRALGEFKIEGIKTNIPFHLKVLADPTFRAGGITTAYLRELRT